MEMKVTQPPLAGKIPTKNQFFGRAPHAHFQKQKIELINFAVNGALASPWCLLPRALAPGGLPPSHRGR